MRLVADQCAQAVCRQYKKLAWHDWVPLGMRQRELELAVRKPTPRNSSTPSKVLWPSRSGPTSSRTSGAMRERAIQQQESPDTVRVILQAVRIGELGIAAIPFEMFSETGLELKARSPFKPSFTIELANGGYGYLPTPEQHKLGRLRDLAGHEQGRSAGLGQDRRRPAGDVRGIEVKQATDLPFRNSTMKTTPACMLALILTATALSAAELRIGGATTSITPDQPVALDGHRNLRISNKIESPVTATVLGLGVSRRRQSARSGDHGVVGLGGRPRRHLEQGAREGQAASG